MIDLLTGWVLLPAVLGLLALGFGEIAQLATGKSIPLALRMVVGFGAYVAWVGVAVLGEVAASIVGVGAMALAGSGIIGLARRCGWRMTRPITHDASTLCGALVVFLVGAAPFVLSGHASFGGYGSLGDGGFQMVGASVMPQHGSTDAGLAPSAVSRVMAQYFETGYPAGGPLALGFPTRWFGTWPGVTYQPFQAVLLALIGLAVAQLGRESGLARGRWSFLVAVVAGTAPLTYAFALQGSVKEVGGAALFVGVAAAIAWGWRPLMSGHLRAGVPAGVLVAAATGVVGPGIAPLILAFAGLIAIPVLVTAHRERLGRRAVGTVAIAGAVAVLGSLPAVFAAAEVSGTAGAVLTAEEEFGNLTERLPWWRPFAAWDSWDFRLLAEFGHPAFAAASAAFVALLVATGTFAAVRKRAWTLVSAVLGSVVAYLYVNHIGSPWAGGKAMALAAPVFWGIAAIIAAGVATRSRGGRVSRLFGKGLAVLLVACVTVAAAYAFGGVKLSPRGRLSELRQVAALVGDQRPVLVAEFDEYTKAALVDARPQVLGEGAFQQWPLRLRSGRVVPAGTTPPLDEVRVADLSPFGWIVVRRGPNAAEPPPSFRLAMSTPHYGVYRRVSSRVPRSWHPAGNGGLASAPVSCRAIRRMGPHGFALIRPRAIVATLRNHPSFWIPRGATPYVLDMRGAGRAQQPVVITSPGRYRLWLEGSFNRDMPVFVDGRRVHTIPRGSTNELVQAEPASSEAGVELAAGSHTVTVERPGAGAWPGTARNSGAVGRLWLESVGQPRLVRASDVGCSDGKVQVDWYGRW